MRSTQKERRFLDVSLGVLSGVFGTLAVDNLVSMFTDEGTGNMRFLLFIILCVASVAAYLKAIRKF
ncbi:hypothetical protein G646_gp193 [Serratia phage phiMAM1]|uniref:Uncharacterized protein n=2 Tax=Miltonvirus MAM1 TaxID=2169689 RepID=K7YJ11_9CAUD|nr:hypothetical protein G646_gp193 [Serratia phage phiMAM1]AFX93661.1 hypothetical protein MAM_193 [Serratia phage phiMAM1]ASZ78973.1 hypothetical protein 2050H1_207 [Serratia phage 2050H1]